MFFLEGLRESTKETNVKIVSIPVEHGTALGRLHATVSLLPGKEPHLILPELTILIMLGS
jgi:hypothetical protein